MSASATQNQWFNRVFDQIRSVEGVEDGEEKDGRRSLRISFNGAVRTVHASLGAVDYRAQKNQFRQIRKTLTELGIREGQTFVAPSRARRALTPDMLAAREKQKRDFEAWQDIWQALRKAENALDAEYELAQMRDYY